MIPRVVQKNLKITCPACDQKLDASEIPAFTQVNCPTCSGEITVPYRFGQYLLEEPLGENRLSGAYRALDLKLSREVALKILDPGLAQNAEAVQAFVEAGRRIAVLTHAHIVPIYSSGDYEGMPFLVMEYMSRRSIADALARTGAALPWPEAVAACEKAARGLDAAHRESMSHGCVTPHNILLGEEGHVKVSDFGLGKFKRLSAVHLRLPIESVMCNAYSSPEAWRGEPLGLHADLYGLGAVLYHLLTGQPPFTADPGARLRSLAALPARRPRDFNSKIPAKLSQVCLALLAPEAAGRPRTYREVIADLTALSEQAARTARPARPGAGGGKGNRPGVAGLKVPLKGRGPVPPDWKTRWRAQREKRKARRVFDAVILVGLLLLLLILPVAAVRRPGWYVRNVEPAMQWVRDLATGVSRHASPAKGATAPAPEEQSSAPEAGPRAPFWQPMRENGTAAPEIDWGKFPVPAAPPTGFDTRPRPPDLDFTHVEGELKAYLQAQPEAFRPIEGERVAMVRSARAYLQRLMQYLPYDGSAGIRLRNGQVVHGVAPYANAQGISVRLKSAGDELVKIRWADLAFEQYLDMYQFYANQRLAMNGVNTGDSRIQGDRDAARDYLLMAVLCDWYGYPDRAAEYAKQARNGDSRMAGPLKRMLFATQL